MKLNERHQCFTAGEGEALWVELLMGLGFSLIFARLMRMKSFKLIINFYEKLTGEHDKTVRERERRYSAREGEVEKMATVSVSEKKRMRMK